MGGASKSEEQSQQTSKQFIDPNQVPFLDFLRRAGQSLASAQISSIGGVADQLSGQLGGIGGELLGGIQDQAGSFGPGVAQAQAGLLNFQPGQSGLDFQGLLEPGAHLPGALSSLDEAIQRNLASTLGTIGGQATLQGQTGGDRQAFFSSEAGAASQREFAGGAAALIGSDLASRRALGPAVAGLELSQLQVGGQQQIDALSTAGQIGLAQQGTNVGAAGTGLDALGGLFDLGIAPFAAAFAPLLALAGIIGPPAIVGESQGSGFSEKGSFNILSFGGSE